MPEGDIPLRQCVMGPSLVDLLKAHDIMFLLMHEKYFIHYGTQYEKKIQQYRAILFAGYQQEFHESKELSFSG